MDRPENRKKRDETRTEEGNWNVVMTRDTQCVVILSSSSSSSLNVKAWHY